MTSVSETYNLAFPPGSKPGFKIGQERKGHCKKRHICGDLVFIVRKADTPHPFFYLEESDGMTNLHCKLKISLVAALVGFETTINHFNGVVLPVKLEAIPTFRYTLTMVSRGMPNGNGYGDLLIHFEVIFPKKLSPRQRRILETIMDEEDLVILENVIRLQNGGKEDMDIENAYSRSMCHTIPNTCMYFPEVEIGLALQAQVEDLLDDDVIDIL